MVLHWKHGLLYDKKILFKLVLKHVIKLAKGSVNNIFQDPFNKILSQQSTHHRSYISLPVHTLCKRDVTCCREEGTTSKGIVDMEAPR